jgi:apolipoprotein N-acyltransferase
MIGLQTGPEAKRMQVGETSVSPNICIETAVERVTVNQLAWLRRRESLPEVIVTVTNDGWFDDSSVMEHHLRCAQLVAVGCRRPILSAGNNGPTAWIDSRGQVVDRLGLGSNGAVIANPQRDRRTSLYVRIGDWPARLCVLLCLAILGLNSRRWRLHS